MTRIGLCSVWIYQGAWKKALGRDERHVEIVGSVPGLTARTARIATKALGASETGLAVWVLSGRRPRRAAFAQTALVITMNAGGLVVARDAIEHPGRLLARNAAVLGAAWSVA